jgi:hypothetical protein
LTQQELDNVRRLMEKYLVLSESQENQRRLRCWELEVCARDQWHGRPRGDGFRCEGLVPITVDLQNTFWLQLFPQDLAQCYQDPVAYLRFHLQKRVAAFHRLPDDTPLDRIVPIYLGTPFESSLFGVPVHFFPDKDPIVDQQAAVVVRSPGDLSLLEAVDFYKSGMMPLAHRLYEGVQEIAGDAFTVVFPEWIRGPFGVALYARGYQDLLVDLVGDPVFADAVLERVTGARQAWFSARAQFLDEPVPPGSLFNDEVDAGVIGPRHYRERILPFESALAQFHGRISYWHSCGNSAPMAWDIVRMERVDLLDVSGWTDLEEVLSSLDGGVPRLEVRLHPVRDLQDASQDWMAERLRRVVTLCRHYDVGAFTIRVSGLQPWTNVEEDIAQVQQWIAIAREVTAHIQSAGH